MTKTGATIQLVSRHGSHAACPPTVATGAACPPSVLANTVPVPAAAASMPCSPGLAVQAR